MKKSVSVIICTYNEVKNIEPTVQAVLAALSKNEINDYELLLLDSGSEDGTVEKIQALEKGNNKIKTKIFSAGYNLGAKYREGIQLASKDYIGYVPGDNETDHESIVRAYAALGRADMILTYTTNPEVRSKKRRVISWLYTFIMNLLFGHHLKYFNGISILPAPEAKAVKLESTGFSYHAEMVLKLLAHGLSYREVPMRIVLNKQSHALGAAGFVDTGKTIARLFWQLRIKKLLG